MLLAVIDVGTNTAKLIAGEHVGGRLAVRVETGRYVRLGEQLEASGRVGPAALERLRRALEEFAQIAAEHGVTIDSVCGTSASREAANRAELEAVVEQATGRRYEILSGEEEARWTYAGTCSAFGGGHVPGGPGVVLDIGGGSTEFVLGAGAEAVVFWRSLPVGTVRLTERCFAAQPPAASAVREAEAVLGALLDEVHVPLRPNTPLIGGSGTIRILARLAGASIPGTLTAEHVRTWRARLLAMTYDEVMALGPKLMRGRADVFAAGVLILDAVMQRFGFDTCRVSPYGLRHGLLLRAWHGD